MAIVFQKEACQPCILFQWSLDQKQKEQPPKSWKKTNEKIHRHLHKHEKHDVCSPTTLFFKNSFVKNLTLSQYWYCAEEQSSV